MKKAMGYTLDLPSERLVIASKTKEGKPTPITDLANFIPFDENGVAIVHKHLDDERVLDIKIVNTDGFIQFFETLSSQCRFCSLASLSSMSDCATKN